jgi:hypothetical protein
MNPLVAFLITYAVMVAIGAFMGNAVGKPLAGILLTMAFGPLGWIFLFLLVREEQRNTEAAKDTGKGTSGSKTNTGS